MLPTSWLNTCHSICVTKWHVTNSIKVSDADWLLCLLLVYRVSSLTQRYRHSQVFRLADFTISWLVFCNDNSRARWAGTLYVGSGSFNSEIKPFAKHAANINFIKTSSTYARENANVLYACILELWTQVIKREKIC